MSKIKILFVSVLLVCLIPINIFAASASDDVWFGNNVNTCSRLYQDHDIATTGVAYFSHCIRYSYNESSKKCSYEYYDDEKVNCLNGNKNPYYESYKDGCKNYDSTSCKDNQVRYCSVIIKYDCSKKRDGSSFTTTKKTTKRTTKPTTGTRKPTTESTTTTIVSTKLKSLSLSKGSIIFNSDTYEYNITLNEEDTSVNVTAIPEDSNSKVEVKNNTNLVNGSVISIVVTSPNGTSSEYKINITKTVKLSNNANLKSLSVTNYDVPFDSKITDYTVVIDEDVKELDIKYEVEDEKSTVLVSNNSNLTNGSKVTISVTAEDGTVKYYYINTLIKAKSNTLGIIFIIILILALVAGGYYLYKKFLAGKGGDKYEYE